MEIRNALTVKNIDSCRPGELFYFDLERARALGLLIRNIESQPLLIGVLHMNAAPEVAPFLLVYANDVQCASFGMNWVLEAQADDNTWPGNPAIEERGGALHFLNEGIALRFDRDPQNIRHSGITVDLGTMQTARLMPSSFASTLRWKIWAAKESPRWLGERPIFEFEG